MNRAYTPDPATCAHAERAAIDELLIWQLGTDYRPVFYPRLITAYWPERGERDAIF